MGGAAASSCASSPTQGDEMDSEVVFDTEPMMPEPQPQSQARRGKRRRRTREPAYGASMTWQRGTLHEGRTGKVWHGILLEEGCSVAVREFLLPEADRSEALRKIKKHFQVRHSSLVDYVAVEISPQRQGGFVLCVMQEWMAEPSVRDTARHFGPIPEHLARCYTTQLLAALECLSREGAVQHGHLRSSCIYIGKGGVARMRDHGLHDTVQGTAEVSWEGRPAESDAHGLGRVVFEMLTGIHASNVPPGKVLEELYRINAKAKVAVSKAALDFIESCFEEPQDFTEAIPARLTQHSWIQEQAGLLSQGLDFFLDLTAMNAPEEFHPSSSRSVTSSRIYTERSDDRSVIYDGSSGGGTPLASEREDRSRRGSKDFQRKSSFLLSPVAELQGEWSLDAVVAKAEAQAAVEKAAAEAEAVEVDMLSNLLHMQRSGPPSRETKGESPRLQSLRHSDPSAHSSPMSSGEMLAEWLDRVEKELEAEQCRRLEQDILVIESESDEEDDEEDEAKEDVLRRAAAMQALKQLESGEMSPELLESWWTAMEIDNLETLTTLSLERGASDLSNFSSDLDTPRSKSSKESGQAWEEDSPRGSSTGLPSWMPTPDEGPPPTMARTQPRSTRHRDPMVPAGAKGRAMRSRPLLTQS